MRYNHIFPLDPAGEIGLSGLRRSLRALALHSRWEIAPSRTRGKDLTATVRFERSGDRDQAVGKLG